MRDEKEERSKQGQTNKQGKATQHCTCRPILLCIHMCTYMYIGTFFRNLLAVMYMFID